MPTLPANIAQERCCRALARLGGNWQQKRGKGSHQAVTMPNGYTAIIPYGGAKRGILRGILKGAGLTVEQFMQEL